MSVGGIRGGGGRGGPKGVKGAGAKGGAGKSSGATFGKVDKAAPVTAQTGLVATNLGGIDGISAQAMEIGRLLKSGEIKSRDEATKRLASAILKEKLKLKSDALAQKIAETLNADPRLEQALNRIWAKG